MSARKSAYLRYLHDMGDVYITISAKEPKSPDKAAKSTAAQASVGAQISPAPEMAAPPLQQPIEEAATSGTGKAPAEKKTELHEFYAQIKDCQKCALGATRTKFVFGTGSADADIMFIGEAPGHEEDLQGIPFVGRAGRLLDKILAAAGLERNRIYIANVLKCRPPENRDPLPAEERACIPYLYRQIEIIQPRLICCLGRIAAHVLLNTKESMGNLRGAVHKMRGIPTIVTYHPAALLRNENLKHPTWDDFQFMLKFLEEQKE